MGISDKKIIIQPIYLFAKIWLNFLLKTFEETEYIDIVI